MSQTNANLQKYVSYQFYTSCDCFYQNLFQSVLWFQFSLFFFSPSHVLIVSKTFLIENAQSWLALLCVNIYINVYLYVAWLVHVMGWTKNKHNAAHELFYFYNSCGVQTRHSNKEHSPTLITRHQGYCRVSCQYKSKTCSVSLSS